MKETNIRQTSEIVTGNEDNRGVEGLFRKVIRAKDLGLEELSPIDLLKEAIERGIEISREEDIDPRAIQLDDMIVDKDHSEQLTESINTVGQLSRILVRVREIAPGVLGYDVGDGFHRGAGAKAAAEQAEQYGDEDGITIQANVLYNYSDEKLQDVRILSASSARSVQFPRIARWMEDSFAGTRWARDGMTVAQGFAIATNDSIRARGHQFAPDDIQELKDWVREKCKLWGGKSPASAYQILRTVADADPELVKQVRSTGGGKDRRPGVTPDRLKTIVDTYPGKKNYVLQNLLMGEVRTRRLTAAETELFVTAFQKKYTPAYMDDNDVRFVMDNIDVESLLDRARRNAPLGEGLSPRIKFDAYQSTHPMSHPDDKAGNNQTQEQPSANQASLVISRQITRRNPAAPPATDFWTQNEGDTPRGNANSSDADLGTTLKVAERKITLLNRELKDLRVTQQTLLDQLYRVTWWRKQEGLSPRDKMCMDLVFTERMSLQEVADKLNLTPKDVAASIARAIGTNAQKSPNP